MLDKCKKIVIKIGSNTLTDENGRVNEQFISSLTEQVSKLIDSGKEVVIVSSGAKVAGVSAIDKWSRKEDMHYKQALCAIGQVHLLETYRKNFEKYGIHIAQMLLTRDDFTQDNRVLNIRNTLFTLLDEGVVPVINENDTVCIEELKIGDNDTLAALTCKIWNADLLVILSDIDGLYNKNPKDHKDAVLLSKVDDIDSVFGEVETSGTNAFGTGGIKTKLQAAKLCNDYEIPMVLTHGTRENAVLRLFTDDIPHTLFVPKK